MIFLIFVFLDPWNELSVHKIIVTYKSSNFKWKILDRFHLNISFVLFDLKYSGEACVEERVVINITLKTTIGRYCGRRYMWSVFGSSPPITLEFHTFEMSISNFALEYQITSAVLKTHLYKFKSHNNVNDIESITFTDPFLWNHNYLLENICHYTWNIVVQKMYRILVKSLRLSVANGSLIIFDGPDINSNQHYFDTNKAFIANTFQVFIMCIHYQNNIEMIFRDNIRKGKLENNHSYHQIKSRNKLKSKYLPCAHMDNVLCILKLFVPRNYFVNITLESLNYSGPNTGYCKYGGLSVYDVANNTMKEVLLLCDNTITLLSNAHEKQVIVSSTQHLFLIFYSYCQYSKIEVNITIRPSTCKGIHLKR